MRSMILALILLIGISCAEKNPHYQERVNPLKDIEAAQERLRSQYIRANSFPVLTKNLDLVFPNENKLGKVILFGKDAQAFYKSLRVVSTDINDSEFYSAINRKTGEFLVCFEMISADEDEGTTYGCELEIQYERGSINRGSEASEIDSSVLPLGANYEGSHLFLDAKDSTKSYILLKENTALVLYSILNVREKEIDRNEIIKEGEDYSCTKVKSDLFDDKITCKFLIDHEKG